MKIKYDILNSNLVRFFLLGLANKKPAKLAGFLRFNQGL
jgi:hypothetical protein